MRNHRHGRDGLLSRRGDLRPNSVPWRHIGKTADVRVIATMVQFFIGGQLVKSHPRKIRGKQTDFGDYLSGEDRVPHADPAMVPEAGRGHRPVM